MKAKGLITLLLMGFILLAGCEENKELIPSTDKIYLNVLPKDTVVFDKTLVQEILVESSSDWKIDARDIPEWLTVAPLEGGKNATVHITAKPNPSSKDERTATINISHTQGLKRSREIEVIQKPSDANVNVTPLSFGFGHEGGTKTLSITGDDQWTLSLQKDWCHASIYSGDGAANIDITCDVNNTGQDREDAISVTFKNSKKTIEIPIMQSSKEMYLNASVENLEFKSEGETICFQILSNTKWSIKSSDSWCHVSPITETGDQEITVEVSKNPDQAVRTAKLTITSTVKGIPEIEVKITQKAGDAPVPVLTLNTESVNFSRQGGTKTVQVSSNVTWSTSCDADWITVSPSNPVNGDGMITINANSNPVMGAQRSAVIYVRTESVEKAITITQDKGEDGYLLSSTTSINLNANAQQTSFDVESNIEWSVSSNESWCSVSSNVTKQNGTVTLNVEKNTGNAAREATITLKSAAKEITVKVRQDALQIPGGDDNPNPNYAKKR